LFAIELDYAAVYAHTLPLRALQYKLRQGKKVDSTSQALTSPAWAMY